MSTKVTSIQQKTLIPASPDEVYEAFMDARKHSAFTGSKATCNPKVGGKFTAWDGYISGRNLELKKRRENSTRMVNNRLARQLSPFKVRIDIQENGRGHRDINDTHRRTGRAS